MPVDHVIAAAAVERVAPVASGQRVVSCAGIHGQIDASVIPENDPVAEVAGVDLDEAHVS